MRQGQNPLRNSGAAKLKPVILSVVTHLPNMTGYHARRLEVIQACLISMRAGAGMDATIAVWDNGSCADLRDWLQFEYRPDLLMLSPNIGKTAARTSLFRMCPPGSIVGYADDDMYFYPGWLEPQIELLKHFPNVAVVTGYPVRTSFRWGCENTIRWARKHAKLETGRFIPDEWERDFATSIGRDPDWQIGAYTQDDTDYRVTHNGRQAYCTSHHCQFVGYQETLVKAARYDGAAMGDEKPMDIRLDDLGLRLATTQRYTRHIGNIMDDALRLEIETCSNTLVMDP